MTTLDRIAAPPEGMETHWFAGAEGWRIRWQSCVPANALGTVIFLSGRADFLEKANEFYHDLVDANWAVVAPEWRGQGLSGRALPIHDKGHIEDFAQYVDDLAALTDSLSADTYPPPWHLVAYSMGGLIALMWQITHTPRFASATLISPMLKLRSGRKPELALRLGIQMLKIMGKAHDFTGGRGSYGDEPASEVQPRLTSDPERFFAVHDHVSNNRELRLGGPTLAWAGAAIRAMRMVRQAPDRGRKEVPTLLLLAEHDQLVDNRAAEAFAQRLPNVTSRIIGDAQHDMLIERDDLRAQVVGGILEHLSAHSRPVVT